MKPLFLELTGSTIVESDDVNSIRLLLNKIPSTPFEEIAEAMANDNTYRLVDDNPREIIITFGLASRSVRLMQCKDVDVTDENSYDQTLRAKLSKKKTESQLTDPPMTAEFTQYIMASLIQTSTIPKKSTGIDEESQSSSDSINGHKGYFSSLRMAAQEHYWLHMGAEERAAVRMEASTNLEEVPFKENLTAVKANWQSSWNSTKWYPDYFRAYVLDQRAALHAWDYVEDDIFVAVDKNRRLVFVNIEKLTQLLFGTCVYEVLVRCLDMWSFYTPLPAPESSRHVVDRYIRKLHPELDPTEATVETLPHAKMAVAHSGCWATKGDPHGRHIVAHV